MLCPSLNYRERRKGDGLVKAIFTALALVAVTAPSISDARHYRHDYRYPATSGYYTARSGDRVRRPVRAARPPAGASAQCRDGSWSFSESRRGTCSWHGGVGRWL
ncbi:DUF3761 domain-containing protein [Sphingomonas sp.]|uniref:DUF3761 domain-containing protein n=1 Tax=Sphingomonas sp. TaxID=28214 RepID=UPI0032C22A35